MEDKKKSTTQKLYDLHKRLNDEGISDEEILDFFFDRLMSIDSLEILRDFSNVIGFDWEGGEDE